MTCDICHEEKPTKHCPICDADLCDSCRSRWDLRTVAALKKLGSMLRVS